MPSHRCRFIEPFCFRALCILLVRAAVPIVKQFQRADVPVGLDEQLPPPFGLGRQQDGLLRQFLALRFEHQVVPLGFQ